MVEIILNILLITILALTIAFCIRLEMRMNDLRSKKNEITQAISSLDVTLAASHQNIDALKDLGNVTLHELTQQNVASQELLDDLRYIVDHGNKLADRLEAMLTEGRNLLNDSETRRRQTAKSGRSRVVGATTRRPSSAAGKSKKKQ